jgi:hypothetical protein
MQHHEMLGVPGRVYEPHGAGIHGVPIMLRNDEGFQKALRNIPSGESFRSELAQEYKGMRRKVT